MEFENFFTKYHKMKNIFEEEGKPMEEESNICFLLMGAKARI